MPPEYHNPPGGSNAKADAPRRVTNGALAWWAPGEFISLLVVSAVASAVLLHSAAWAGEAPPPPPVDFEACKRDALALPADTESARSGVLAVRTPDGIGAAVVISPDGTALTAAHVVGTHKTVDVRTPQGLELTAEVLWADDDSDIAVIDVAGKGHTCLVPADERLVAGADVFAIGSPADEALAFSISKGVVSGHPNVNGGTFLQTDASLNPGNSGGPLLGSDGTVAAIVSWKVAAKEFEGLGFGIPMDVIREHLEGSAVLGSMESGGLGTRGRKDLAKVKFTTPGDGVTIGLSTLSSAAWSTQYGTGVINQMAVDDVCIAPCEHDFKPDVYTLVAYSDKYQPTTHKVDLRAGTTRDFTVNPRPRFVGQISNGLISVGTLSAIVGASMWGVGALLGPTDGGGVGRTGIGMTVGGLIGVLGGVGINIGTKPKWTEATTAADAQ